MGSSSSAAVGASLPLLAGFSPVAWGDAGTHTHTHMRSHSSDHTHPHHMCARRVGQTADRPPFRLGPQHALPGHIAQCMVVPTRLRTSTHAQRRLATREAALPASGGRGAVGERRGHFMRMRHGTAEGPVACRATACEGQTEGT